MWDRVNEILNQSADRITASIANFLPGLLAVVIVLLLTLLVAWIVRRMLRRFLRSVDFDRRLDQWWFSGVSEWLPSKSPALMVARIGFWTIILVGLTMGASIVDRNLTAQAVMGLFVYLPNVLAAVLALIVGMVVVRFLARGVLISAVNMHIQSASLLSLGVKWLVMVLAGAMALEHLGIGGAIIRMSFGILFGGIVLALALAIGLGSKDMVSHTWEHQVSQEKEEAEEPFHHL